MTAAAQFAAVDWGTSGFRLWLVGGPDSAVLAERKSREGMTIAAQTGFDAVLESHLEAVLAPADLPVIICGMAGARQGWIEAGYADVPTGLSDLPERAIRIDGQRRDIRILPGLAQRDVKSADVMRGEETQLLGASGAMTGSLHRICMPGTHSKWVSVDKGIVTGFSTFMTGELFAAISKATILEHAVKGAGIFDENAEAFGAAVEQAWSMPGLATNYLFSIRARGLLFGASATDSQATLSGTLIGLELAGALGAGQTGSDPVILVAEGRLAALYQSAFTRIGIAPALIDADKAVLGGLSLAARTIWPHL